MLVSNVDRETIASRNSLWKNIFNYIVVIFAVVALVAASGYFLFTYKTDKFQIKGTNISNNEAIIEIVSNYISVQPMIKVDANAMKKDITVVNPLVKEISIDKSLQNGIIVTIKEYSPIILVETLDERQYILTEELVPIEITESENGNLMPLNYYLGVEPKDENIYTFAKKVKTAREKVDALNINGRYSFDNFGNLSILIGESRVVKLDLNERFFTIDEQVKLLQDALAKTQSYSEIDLRFTYLLIK